MSIKGFSVGGNVERYDYNFLDNRPSEITVDTALSDSSTNPVQNSAVTNAINAANGSISSVSGEVDDLRSALDEAIEDFAVPTQEAVDNWLNAHPEATTTVQDGSLTEGKFTDSLKLKTIKDYVTPQMYGAMGDGVTDDYQAIQNALDASKTVIIPNGTYKCNHSLNIHTLSRIIGIGDPELIFNGSGIVAEDTYYRFVLIQGLTIRASVPLDFSSMRYSISESVFRDLRLYGDTACILAPQNGKGSATGTFAIWDCTFEDILISSNDKGICNICFNPRCAFINIFDGGNVVTPFYNTCGSFYHCNIGFSHVIENMFLFDGNIRYYGMILSIDACNFELIRNSLIKCTSTSLGFADISVHNSTISFDPNASGITDAMMTLSFPHRVTIDNPSIGYFDETHDSKRHISFNTTIPSFPEISVPDYFVLYNAQTNVNINYKNGMAAGFRPNDAEKSFFAIKAEYARLANLGVKIDVSETANNRLKIPYCTCANVTSVVHSTIYTMVSELTNVQGKSAFDVGFIMSLINSTGDTINLGKLNDTTENGFAEAYTIPNGESISLIMTISNGYRRWKKI